MKDTQLVDLFQRSRADKTLVVIEGVQALKHAVRFNAEVLHVVTSDTRELSGYLEELAPDTKQIILKHVMEVDSSVFSKLSPQPPRTNVIAVAKRRQYRFDEIEQTKKIVFLEDPRDLENIGAVIRVSAAADVGAVCISGPADIWHPAVIRGAAGLHFALPVLSTKLSQLIASERQIVALDPTGINIDQVEIKSDALLIFGTERHGISQGLLKKSDVITSLPMRKGVSSLNLATSVAATLFR